MNDQGVLQLAGHAMATAAELAAPILAVSLLIGLIVSLFQSVTQIQEVTLTFVPKLVGVGLVIMIGGHWMLGEMVGFTNQLFAMIPRLLQTA